MVVCVAVAVAVAVIVAAIAAVVVVVFVQPYLGAAGGLSPAALLAFPPVSVAVAVAVQAS